MVQSSPGVTPKPRFGPNMNSTERVDASEWCSGTGIVAARLL